MAHLRSMKRWRSLIILFACCAGVTACASTAPGVGAPTPSHQPPSKTTGPQRWGTVTGTVRDAHDQPVAGALVVPSALGPSAPPVPEIAVRSAQDGSYAWQLLPGRYTFVARTGEQHSAGVTVTVVVGGRVSADLTLQA